MSDQEKLSYESGQFRFGEQSRTWNVRDGKQEQCFEHTEKSVRSGHPAGPSGGPPGGPPGDPPGGSLEDLDKKIRESDKKLEKLRLQKGVIGQKYLKIGRAEIGLKEKPGRGRLYSRTSTRLINRVNPELDSIHAGPVRVRLREAGWRDYRKKHSRQRRLENRAYIRGRLMFREAAKALDDDSLRADETDTFPAAMKTMRNSGRLLYMGSRRMTHKLLEKNNAKIDKRFDTEKERNMRLKEEHRRLSERQGIPEEEGHTDRNDPNSSTPGNRDGKNNSATGSENGRPGSGRKGSSAASEAHKKRVKKQQIAEHHRQKQGNISKRASGFRHKTKKVRERAGRTKRALAGVFSVIGAALLAAGAAFLLLFVLLAMISSGTSIGTAYISMNDYSTMTEITNYFNDKCTNLYIYLNIDRDKNIEPDLEKELNIKINGFNYDVGKAITYDQIGLVAYLSAKYGSFTLDDVRADLEEIFAKMFNVAIEVKDNNICHVTLEVTSFDDVVADRLTDGQKNSYLGYQLSSCGQQVMNPVLEEAWTELISSPFGSRYHPIHKEYRMHNGVDIAVPTGTKVYAAVSGEVTAAGYSDSEGYMVSITDENGFTVTYMHLSSYPVAEGQKISAGQMVALSGNTGNSTGPHLHLAVQDAEGNYLNPVFMIPQTSVKQ